MLKISNIITFVGSVIEYLWVLSDLLVNCFGHSIDISWANATVHLNVQPVEDEDQFSCDAVHARKFIGDSVQFRESHISHSLEAKEVDNLKKLRWKEADDKIAQSLFKSNTSLKVGLRSGTFPRSSLLEDVAAFTTLIKRKWSIFPKNATIMTKTTHASTLTETPMW